MIINIVTDIVGTIDVISVQINSGNIENETIYILG
jgi:hypothetical protein